METKKVPFIRECSYCGITLGVEWLDYNTLSPTNIQMYEKYHKITSHGMCESCFDKEMAEEAEDTCTMDIAELEAYLKEEE